jgi:hypothetical protein
MFRFTAYETYTELSYWDLLSQARVNFPLGRFGLFTGLRFDRVRRSPIDLDDIRPVEELRQLELGGTYRLSPRSSLVYTFRNSDFQIFDDDLGNLPVDIAPTQDRVERSQLFDFQSNILARTTFLFRGEAKQIDFKIPSLSGLPELSRDSHAISFLPGITLGDYGSLVGTLQIGWAKLEYDGEAILGYSGLVGEADIVYSPIGRTTFKWEAWRRVGYSVTALNNFYVDNNSRLGVIHFLNRIVGINTRFDYGRLDVPATERKDKILGFAVGVLFRSMSNSMGGRVEYSVLYRRSNRNSSNPGFDRSYASLTFNAHFGY